MKTIYRGHEIDVRREQSMGGDSNLYYSIFRVSDGYECTSGFTSDASTPAEYTTHMKARVDAELAEADPWGEEADEFGVTAAPAPKPGVLDLIEKLDGYLTSPEQIALRDALLAALIPDGVAVGAPGATDAERAAWLADKIVALGDYAKEAAAMLRRWPDGVNPSAEPSSKCDKRGGCFGGNCCLK